MKKEIFAKKIKIHTKITNFYIKNEIFSQKSIQNVSKLKKTFEKCERKD